MRDIILQNSLNSVIQKLLNEFDVTEKTKISYKLGLKKFQIWTTHNPGWFSPEGLVKYKQWLNSKYNSDSVNTYLTPVIKLYERFGVNVSNYITMNKKKKSRRESFTLQEIRSLLNYVKHLPCKTTTDMYIRARDYAMIRLISKTGLREMSVNNLRIEDLSVKEGKHIAWVLVKGHKERDEYVVLLDGLYEDLKQCLHGRQSGYVFIGYGNRNNGKQLSERHIRKIITDHMIAARIKRDSNCVHALRNTFIQMALSNGASLQQTQLAVHHNDPKTTMGYAGDLDRINQPAEAFVNQI